MAMRAKGEKNTHLTGKTLTDPFLVFNCPVLMPNIASDFFSSLEKVETDVDL